METKPPKWSPPLDVQQNYNQRAAETDFRYPQTGQPYLYPQQAIPASNEGWFERNQKNKPQSNSVGAAALIFTCGGMSAAWGLGFNPWNTSCMTIYMNVCWFVMAIIGAAVGASLTNIIKKKTFMLISTVMVLVGGILFLSLYDNCAAIMAARHLNGFAIGLLIVPTLVMGGEEAVLELRGMITSSIEIMCFSLGLYLQIIYAESWAQIQGFTANQMHGTILVIFSVISLALVCCLVIESPVYFLVRNQEQAAIECLRRLQTPSVVSYETFVQLNAHKTYVSYNKEKSRGEAIRESWPALFKLSILRAIVGMSFSLVMNLALIHSSAVSRNAIWPAILYGTCRYIGIIVSVFLQDRMGRKKPLAFGMLTSGCIAFGTAICFTWPYDESSMTAAMYLLIFYQFFVGLAITSSSVYLSEAFALAIKPYCIAIAFTVEMISQILCASFDISSNSYSPFFYVLGAISVEYFILTLKCLPETKKTTLKDAQIKFQSWCSKGFN